jgi:hypothetical protein
MTRRWLITPSGLAQGVYSTEEVWGFFQRGLIRKNEPIRDNDTNACWTAETWVRVFASSLPPSPPSDILQSTGTAATARGPDPMHTRQTNGVEDVLSTTTHNNPFGLAGFWFGVASVFLHSVGAIPLLGLVLSGIGLATYDETKHRNRWQAGWGMGLNLVYMLFNAYKNGHFT